MQLSIIATMYNSRPYIKEFHERISRTAQLITTDYELILVDDGSPDTSLSEALELQKTDPKIKIVQLSRNFGHHKAMMVGLRQSKGDFVFLIDIDLEEEPENLKKFWEKMQQDPTVDVVYGLQSSRKDPFYKRIISEMFYWLFNLLSNKKINKFELVSRLMKRDYVNALNSYKEYDVFIPGLWVDAGFKQTPCLTERCFNENSSYTIGSRIVLAINALTSFSSRPLMIIFLFGLCTSALSMFFIIYLIIQKLFMHSPALGWTSILASIYLTGGLVIFSVGVVGIYLSRVYNECKLRPYAIIKSIISTEET